jgi:hypothetical protein
MRASLMPACVAGALLLAGAALPAAADTDSGPVSPVYSTRGIHNPAAYSNCDPADCLVGRAQGEPSDPLYPAYWTASWNMYVVTNHYDKYSPPYDGKPPAALVEGRDYTVSKGWTYYDSTWTGGTGTGAMMEYYEKKCLPIFPIDNNFSCSFISLGNRAFFVTYDDRPNWMPKVCLFSPLNHPPRRNFIQHLPYSKGDSQRISGNVVQGYSVWVSRKTGAVTQVGVSPDRTQDGDIMFGYGFNTAYTPDATDKNAAPYRHPQSFYFSGFPGYPKALLKKPVYPFAPIVSQNYTSFSMLKPDPAKTWNQVADAMVNNPPPCQLFEPPKNAKAAGVKEEGTAEQPAPGTWGDIPGK